jgi:tagatose 6-phosphate kinase
MTIHNDEDIRTALRKLGTDKSQWFIITRGAQPAIVSDGRSFWRVTPPRVNTVNPIGSGDSLTAGLIVELVNGSPLPKAMALGFACASANAMTQRCAEVHMADVERLLPQVKLEEM